MGVVSNSISVSVVSNAAPSWFTSMTEKTWIAIANSAGQKLDDVKPNPVPSGTVGQRAVCDTWTGACANQVTGEFIMPANGGHVGYSGNEVYALALRVETPAWTRITNPSTATGGTDARQTQGHFGDGRPRPSHTWTRPVCDSSGKVWLTGLGGMYSSGQMTSAVWSFDRPSLGSGPFPVANAPWTYHGQGNSLLLNGSASNWQSGCSAYDSNRNWVWAAAEVTVETPPHPFFSVDCSTGSITNYPAVTQELAQNEFSDSYCVFAASLDAWIVVSPNFSRVYVLNPNNPNVGFRWLTPSGSPTGYATKAGCVWHAPSQSILVWHPLWGTEIRKLYIPSNPHTDAGSLFIWSSVTANGGGATPAGTLAGDFAGCYSKFQIINDMGNGRAALVTCCRTTNATYVYKCPESF